ncbi:MAG: hypothetical protein AAF489_14555, partial [Bacteroidota bacterium]
PVFVPEDVDLTTVLVVSDQDAEGAGRFKSAVQKILSGAGPFYLCALLHLLKLIKKLLKLQSLIQKKPKLNLI